MIAGLHDSALTDAGLRAVAEYRKTQLMDSVNRANRYGGACMWAIVDLENRASSLPGDFGNPEKAKLIDKAEELRRLFREIDTQLPGIKGPR